MQPSLEEAQVQVHVQGTNWYHFGSQEKTEYQIPAETCSRFGFLESLLKASHCQSESESEQKIILEDDGKLVAHGSGVWHCVLQALTVTGPCDFYVPFMYLKKHPYSLLLSFG